MYKENPDLEVPNDNMTIWRYLDFTKFVSTLDRQALFFCRADRLGDPFEGSYTKASVLQRKELVKYNFANDILGATIKVIKEFTTVNCWHINRHESAAMWKLYLKSSEGIAIRTTLRRLRDSLQDEDHDIFIGKVHYIDYEKDEMPKSFIAPFVHKRKSFEHEVELRAIIQELPEPKSHIINSDERPFENGLYVPVDLELLINEIYLAPTSPQWLKELVERVTARYGLKKKVRQSILDEKPLY